MAADRSLLLAVEKSPLTVNQTPRATYGLAVQDASRPTSFSDSDQTRRGKGCPRLRQARRDDGAV